MGRRHGDRRAEIPLDPARDTLVNVDAMGRAVPARAFMGGRECRESSCRAHKGDAYDSGRNRRVG
jgi:hypothetical protein